MIDVRDAEALLSQLTRQAAVKNDHLVSDEFVRIVHGRLMFTDDDPPWSDEFILANEESQVVQLRDSVAVLQQVEAAVSAAERRLQNVRDIKRVLWTVGGDLRRSVYACLTSLGASSEEDEHIWHAPWWRMRAPNGMSVFVDCLAGETSINKADIVEKIAKLPSTFSKPDVGLLVCNGHYKVHPDQRSEIIDADAVSVGQAMGLRLLSSVEVFLSIQSGAPAAFWDDVLPRKSMESPDGRM